MKDPDAEKIDELLEAVDLSSYGLERVKLSHSIGLDASETELDPQNANPVVHMVVMRKKTLWTLL